MIPLTLAVALADVCARVPTGDGDATDAPSYIAVGDEARAKGDLRVAAVAYANALDADPGSEHARTALDELCRDERNRAAATNLMSAIARFEAGEYGAARAQLAPLVAAGGPLAAGAHMFLGLIALAAHRHDEAIADLELAQRDPTYAQAAALPLRLAHRDGPITLLALAAQEVDTNPELLPDTPPTGATSGPPRTDGDLLLAGTLTARPAPWLYVRDELWWRKQYTLTPFDFLSETAEAGSELATGSHRFALAYVFGYDALAGSPYLITSGVTAAYRRQAVRADLVASGTFRRRDYQQDADAGFTGWVASFDGGAVVHATPRLDLEARMVVTRENTGDPTFASYAGGIRLGARARIGSRLRVFVLGTAWYATYDAAEPDGTERRDWHGELGVDAEYDLGDYVLASCAAQVVDNTSTVADFVYHKLVARCGLAFAWGGP
jgi:hypothetical protein